MMESWSLLMERGGPVMWPLLGLSVLAVALSFERAMFYMRTNNPSRVANVSRLAKLLRRGEWETAKTLAAHDRSVYGDLVMSLMDEPAGGGGVGSVGSTEAIAFEAVEAQRPRLERYLVILSTIITASPLLGILGTVIGIIASFEALSSEATTADPRLVGAGIAQALLTTAAGLVVALITLFPYVLFRVQSNRTLTRLEVLAAAAAAAPARARRAAG